MSATGRGTIEAFVDGRITADEFEASYLALVKQTPGRLETDVSSIVNRLFSDVDAYVSDDRLRDDDDLDAHQLLACAVRALGVLRQIVKVIDTVHETSGADVKDERPEGSVTAMLAVYEDVIKSFVNGETSADEFETVYLRAFKLDVHQVDVPECNIIEDLFFDVDDYVAEDRLRTSQPISRRSSCGNGRGWRTRSCMARGWALKHR